MKTRDQIRIKQRVWAGLLSYSENIKLQYNP